LLVERAGSYLPRSCQLSFRGIRQAVDIIVVLREEALGVEPLVVLDSNASGVVYDLVWADIKQVWGGVLQPEGCRPASVV
jgi:hypothetical protein